MPEIEQVRTQYEHRGIGFLAVSLEPNQARVRTAVQQLGIKMMVATTEDEILAPLAVNQVPSTVFIDKDGVIVIAVSGERSKGFFEKRLKALLR